ncbi:MAG: alpha/beta hydrolase [Clostridia bacterium]|nr:alpha/beta hydrolase [Clostridia bacterium]
MSGMIRSGSTLGELLSDARIAPVAKGAIRGRDLKGEDVWSMPLARLREGYFASDLEAGFERLFKASEDGNWYYPLYSPEECEKDASLEGANLVFFPSDDPKAQERPFILLVPGGGFVHVWNLTEGWPVAARFNRLGYHVLILTYQVTAGERLLDRNMRDFARALTLARAHAEEWKLKRDQYITCGFSAGGYLVCLWNVPEKGYAAFGLPAPRAVFPVYPLVSWAICLRDGAYEPEEPARLFGCSIEEAVSSPYEIPGHAEGFPPCALFLTAGDTLVKPEHSRLLAGTLEKKGIPCRLEIGPEGGHGFGDGTGMCMEGWQDRAVAWYESLA